MALFVILPCLTVQAEDPKADDLEQQQIERWMNLYAEIAAEHQVSATNAKQMKLQFQRAPLLRYTNPVRQRQQHGALFVWTRSDRPEVVGTLWSKQLPNSDRRRIATEFHSLSDDRVVADYAGKRVWNPSEAGIQLQLIPNAPSPADSPNRRLFQLRNLAREFVAKSVDDQQQPLRLMPQPLYRYGGDDKVVLDGGLFAFVMATDPELILLIEARRAGTGHRWHFAAARFTNAALELRHREATVWSCPGVTPTNQSGSYYYNPQIAVRAGLIE